MADGSEHDAKRAKQTNSSHHVNVPSPNVKLCVHPIVQHKLTQLRRGETSAKHFRELLDEITLYLGFEGTRDLSIEEHVVETPASKVTGQVLASKVAIVPIMRGGLGLVHSMLTIVPMATVHHIGMYNNPESLLPVLYYNKLPSECHSDVVYVLDVQIGSGATLIATIDIIKEWMGTRKTKIKVITVLSSRLGLSKVTNAHPDVDIYLAAIDDSNETGLPIPGLGDPGNRMFNAD